VRPPPLSGGFGAGSVALRTPDNRNRHFEMSQPEHLFHARINRRLPRQVYAEKMHNIYRGGTPDYWYSGFKADLWVEYKWVKKLPVKADVKTGLSGLQKLWLNDAWKKGRNVCVIIGAPTGCVVLQNGAWNEDISRGKFVVTEQAVAEWIIWEVHDPTVESTDSGNEPGVQALNNVVVNSGSVD